MRLTIFLLFLILLAGSVVYAHERILFSDASFIMTDILNSGKLQIQAYRYGSFITQLFPLLAGKAHLPLTTVVLLYSMSFNLFYLAIASIILFRFRNIALAVLMAFYYTLFVTDTYYWTNNELHQAIAWMFLLLALITGYKRKTYSFALHSALFLVLAFLSIFTHPLILLVLPYLWLFVLMDRNLNPYTRKQSIMFSCGLILICAVKFYLMKQGGYDNDKLAASTRISIQDVLDALVSPMSRGTLTRMVTQYYFLPPMFLAGLWFAVKERQFRHIRLTLFFVLGYFTAACLTFREFIPFYTESEWMPFSIIMSTLFVYYVLPKIKPAMATALLSLIFAVRVGYMVHAGTHFVERKKWTYAVLDQMKRQRMTKGYFYTTEAIQKKLMIEWALPTESLVASALQGNKPNRTFVMDKPGNIKGRITDAHSMISSFGNWHYKELNPYYFQIDTTSNYQLIPGVDTIGFHR